MYTGKCLLRFMTALPVSSWNITSIKLFNLLFLHAKPENANRTVSLNGGFFLFMYSTFVFASDCVSLRNTSLCCSFHYWPTQHQARPRLQTSSCHEIGHWQGEKVYCYVSLSVCPLTTSTGWQGQRPVGESVDVQNVQEYLKLITHIKQKHGSKAKNVLSSLRQLFKDSLTQNKHRHKFWLFGYKSCVCLLN